MIRITPGTAAELDREWLDTDDRGGYAAGTLAGWHTRRYHGLMVANLRMPEGRHCLLSKLEDSLACGQEEHFFTPHRYPGAQFPPGPPLLGEFTLAQFPRFSYRTGTLLLHKGVMLVQGTGDLLVRYDLERAPAGGLLRLKPFLAYRGYHELARENTFLRSQTEGIANGFAIDPYAGMPPLSLRTSLASRFHPSPLWYRRFEYTEERERGFDWHEDLFLPGVIEVPCEQGETVILLVSADPTGDDPAALWDAELARREREIVSDRDLTGGSIPPGGARKGPSRAGDGERDGRPGDGPELLAALVRAGRQFLIRTPSGRPAVIAGYPWFGSWGRDTLISLPGLAFCTDRIGEGVEILAEIGRHEREGLLPNFFSGDGRPEAYNTVDSSLLFFRAVQELYRVTGDAALIRERFWPVMTRIIRSFMIGTRFAIGMDERGLLHAGDGKNALTWMDATVGGTPVTPRDGYPVEINALWYNALCFARDLAELYAETGACFAEVAARTRASFREAFWIPAGGYLGDVVQGGTLDPAVRPNQLFAVSLPFSPLTSPEQADVVRKVREELLTPCGLRTLAPGDPAYRGRYRGTGPERDAAYHQGTVWPWLLGLYGEASLKVAADREAEKATLRTRLCAFLRGHLPEAGIGSVSEVFDGDAPHRPGGCIAQAWSVAELIRLFLLLR